MTVSLQRRLAAGLTFNQNYTYSHALHDVSNGGVQPFGILVTNASILDPQNPNNIRSNYGNSDYDVRHYFSATFMLTDMFRHAGFKRGPNRIFGGWTLSSNWFYRSGLPFSITDNAAAGTLGVYNYNGGAVSFFATPLGSIAKACTSAVNAPCLTTAQFAPSVGVTGIPTGFGTIGRNSVYGPNFFDIDASLKDVKLTEKVNFSFGVQVYNLLNHANFDQPVGDISRISVRASTRSVRPQASWGHSWTPAVPPFRGNQGFGSLLGEFQIDRGRAFARISPGNINSQGDRQRSICCRQSVRHSRSRASTRKCGVHKVIRKVHARHLTRTCGLISKGQRYRASEPNGG